MKRKEESIEKAKRSVKELMLSKRGCDYLYENGNRKRISAKRIFKILSDFIKESVYMVIYAEGKGKGKGKGGYYEYYLIHSDEYSKEEIADFSKFFNTLYHLNNMLNIPELKDRKFFTVEKLLRLSSACMIFEYKYSKKEFQEWQDRLFKILTLQELPDKK